MPGNYLKGTLQFMTLALLEAVKRKKPLEHTPSHDLESIIYVLLGLHGSAACCQLCRFSEQPRRVLRVLLRQGNCPGYRF